MSDARITKIDALRDGFYEFLECVVINSKEFGAGTRLIEHLYRGQYDFYEAVFDGLRDGIHNFYCLKSRQLGMSTAIRPLMIYWAGMHEGLQGAMVYDTPFNTARARREITEIIKALPKRLHFPQILRDTREGIELEGTGPGGSGGSQILFMSAGVKNARSGGGLGRSLGLNFANCSEISSWVNEEGLVSFRQSLSETFPDRLYIWESTARGYNIWYKMWREAKSDELGSRAIFLGWWSKDNQAIERGTPEFTKYGTEAPTPNELKHMDAVRDLYGWQITREQLAWYRKKTDPNQEHEEGEEEDANLLQEQPWDEFECFQMTGSSFFQADKLGEAAAWAANQPKPQAFRFIPGIDFVTCEIFPAKTRREVELRVWEEPCSDSVYVISGDPAFGHNEHNNNSCAQVLRCYADGIDQVAEYATATIDPQQFSWLLWTLVGYYGTKPNTTVGVIIEINGPGEEVVRSFDRTRQIVQQGFLRARAREKGLTDIFTNVRQYIYQRTDSMHAGHNRHWKCLSVHTRIPTPSGWKLMSEVRMGDELFDEQGQLCRVTFAPPVQLGHACFDVTFDDGSKITADADHLWEVEERWRDHETLRKNIVKTIDLIPGEHFIPLAEPLELPNRDDLHIHPYVLGVWLGDGHSRDALMSCHRDDFEEFSEQLKAFGHEMSLRYTKGNVYTGFVEGLKGRLKQLGLLNNKHLPHSYLRASFEQRLWLLQGLMDTDGSIDKQRQCSFTTTNYLLSRSFAELLRSVGIKSKMCVRQRTLLVDGEPRECAQAYQFWFTGYSDLMVFRLKRKRERLGPSRQVRVVRTSRRYKIVSVERAPTVPVRCISVDSQSKLYLAGDAMVPTHNTNSQLKEAIFVACRDYWANGVLRVRSMEAIEEAKVITRDGATIGAEGRDRDDRVFALAMGLRHWEDKFRRGMITGNRTREAEHARLAVTIEDQYNLWRRNTLDMFFKAKADARILAARQQMRNMRPGLRRPVVRR